LFRLGNLDLKSELRINPGRPCPVELVSCLKQETKARSTLQVGIDSLLVHNIVPDGQVFFRCIFTECLINVGCSPSKFNLSFSRLRKNLSPKVRRRS